MIVCYRGIGLETADQSVSGRRKDVDCLFTHGVKCKCGHKMAAPIKWESGAEVCSMGSATQNLQVWSQNSVCHILKQGCGMFCVILHRVFTLL